MDKIINKKIKQIILELAEVASFLWQRGWAERNAGNISVNISQLVKAGSFRKDDCPFFELDKSYPSLANEYFLVTGTGKRMRDLAHDPLKNAHIIRLNETASAYWILSCEKSADNFRPTSELPTHLDIHRMISERGSGEKVVMHAHISELIALTQLPEFCNAERLNRLIWGMHPETMMFIPQGIGFVPYVLPGSEAIAQLTSKELEKHDLVMWEKHGAFAIGSSIFEAFDLIDIVAKAVKIWFMCKSAGYTPQGLDEEELADLKKLITKSNQ